MVGMHILPGRETRHPLGNREHYPAAMKRGTGRHLGRKRSEGTMANEKQHAHELIELLPLHQLSAVVGLLEAIIDPVSRKLAAAPVDDEPETEEERRAVEQFKEWLRQRGGKGISNEEVLQDFGLTTEDFRRMAHGKKD
jgi:hypothetical protein